MPATERNRSYRARRAADGKPAFASGPSGRSGKNKKRISSYPYSERHFVAVDSEGFNLGNSFASHVVDSSDLSALASGKSDKSPGLNGVWHNHRTFLWGAGTPTEYHSLCHSDKRSLTTEEILDWLCTLPSIFGPQSIFVSFAFGYDATQIISGFTHSKAFEVHKGRGRAYTLYGDYGIRYLKGKMLTVVRLRNPNAPFRITKNGDQKLDYTDRITIYDTHGFFQTSFLNAVRSIPGVATHEEYETLKAGKKIHRLDFANYSLDTARRYNAIELRLLCLLMDRIRASCDGMGLSLKRWNGAGSIASAVMHSHDVVAHYPETLSIVAKDPSLLQQWAMQSFFGGRIELFKFGVHNRPVYTYDITSAYPYAQSKLSSMRGGAWYRQNGYSGDDGEYILHHMERMDSLSMIQVSWEMTDHHPIAPFPYRVSDGSIFFPPCGRGRYNVVEVSTVYKHILHSGYPCELDIENIFEFVPATREKPFSFLEELFAARRELIIRHQKGGIYDLTEKVLKLGYNSCYGKTAQKVGGTRGKNPPKFANPYYAAAITAKTRSMLFDAAMEAPENIIMFATDGIASSQPLSIAGDVSKDLGSWESVTHAGGAFIMSGVYGFRKTDGSWTKLKNRGFSATGDFLEKCIAAWGRGEEEIMIDEHRYMTLGASIVSPDRFTRCGYWVDLQRRISLDGCGRKRILAEDCSRREASIRLLNTRPAPVPDKDLYINDGSLALSWPYTPEWLDMGHKTELEWEQEQVDIEDGLT